MTFWMKFDNHECFNINSACTNDTICIWGGPTRLPAQFGLYRNWGAFFDFGDVLEVSSVGIMDAVLLNESWTVSFWTILPMDVFETHKKHILIQSIEG